MTRETAQKLLPMIQAYAEGKEVQYLIRVKGEDWQDAQEPTFDPKASWRIKPREPREFWACWNKDADLDDPENELRLYAQKQSGLGVGRQQIRVREIIEEETA